MDHTSINDESKAVIFLAEHDEVTNNVIKNVASILDEENFLIYVVKIHGEEGSPGIAGVMSSSPSRKKFKYHIKDGEQSDKSGYCVTNSTTAAFHSSKEILPFRLKYQELVGMCKMPVFVDQSISYLCYGGLCTVVRMMVKHVQKSKPLAKVISLLVGI